MAYHTKALYLYDSLPHRFLWPMSKSTWTCVQWEGCKPCRLFTTVVCNVQIIHDGIWRSSVTNKSLKLHRKCLYIASTNFSGSILERREQKMQSHHKTIHQVFGRQERERPNERHFASKWEPFRNRSFFPTELMTALERLSEDGCIKTSPYVCQGSMGAVSRCGRALPGHRFSQGTCMRVAIMTRQLIQTIEVREKRGLKVHVQTL